MVKHWIKDDFVIVLTISTNNHLFSTFVSGRYGHSYLIPSKSCCRNSTQINISLIYNKSEILKGRNYISNNKILISSFE